MSTSDRAGTSQREGTSHRPPGPREWIGDGEYPWPPTLGLDDGADVVACFSIHRVDVGRTRNDAAFLKLRLADSHGIVEARMWEGVDDVADVLHTGAYVGVRGRLERYQQERQLRIDQIALLQVELDDLVLFLPRSARPAAVMDAELNAFVSSVRDDGLRELLLSLLGPETETGHAFRLAPAAKQNHHAYLGGLIEHTLSVTTVCDLLARHYGSALDRDLLIAGALLHDLGKVREIGARAGFPYTDEGKLLGHILIGMQMVVDAAATVPSLEPARLLLLQHLIASHQGRYEWQSPREPRTLEALLLHYADDLDAKLNQAGSLVAAVPIGWSAYDRGFARDFLRHRDEAPEAQPAAAVQPTQASQGTAAAAAPDTIAHGQRAGSVASGVNVPAATERVQERQDVQDPEDVKEPQDMEDPQDAEKRREAQPQNSPVLDTLDLFDEG